jgi:hypothetical protein
MALPIAIVALAAAASLAVRQPAATAAEPVPEEVPA